MKIAGFVPFALAAVLLALAGCATRPVNPPLAHVDAGKPYKLHRSAATVEEEHNLVILAFSGGGTRAAAFSYGVLETLRRTEIVTKDGKTLRLLDLVDIITGVSGGSFTALAYRLYGEQLFDEYEKRFLKRNVQGELTTRALNPANWGALSSTGWGRSELAANLYDEILFDGATFAHLERTDGPVVAVSTTDITTGARVVFTPQNFDVMCADLGPIRIARAAAASSAVPVVLSPLTLNNYGGSCGYRFPAWTKLFLDAPEPPRPAARVLNRLHELHGLADGSAPYLHLVDGGVADNLGLRGVLDILQLAEALHEAGQKTPLDGVKRIVVFVVNSLSVPVADWARREDAPGTVDVLIKATGVPIDRYSGEQVEQLKDMEARWDMLQRIRATATFKDDGDPAVAYVKNAPDIDLYTVDVSFAALQDKKELAYLNQLPTSFVLKNEEVDRLRAAAGKIVLESREFKRLLGDLGARIVETPRKAP